MAGGGHGFQMMEDTELLEVKQGPYPGEDEKGVHSIEQPEGPYTMKL